MSDGFMMRSGGGISNETTYGLKYKMLSTRYPPGYSSTCIERMECEIYGPGTYYLLYFPLGNEGTLADEAVARMTVVMHDFESSACTYDITRRPGCWVLDIKVRDYRYATNGVPQVEKRYETDVQLGFVLDFDYYGNQTQYEKFIGIAMFGTWEHEPKMEFVTLDE